MSRTTTRPDKLPDISAEACGEKYAFEYWDEEQVISFNNTVAREIGYFNYFRFGQNKRGTPKDFMEFILKQNGPYKEDHPHYIAVYAYFVESALLG